MRSNLYAQDLAGSWMPMRVSGSEIIAPWSYAPTLGGISDTADVTIAAAPGAGKCNYVTSLQVMNSSLVQTEVVVKSGATVLWRSRVGPSMIMAQAIVFARPLIGAVNTALTVACLTTASLTYINVQGYQDAPAA